MTGQQHIIQKVTFDLDFGGEEHVQSVQNKYRDSFQKKVLPELEKMFDNWSVTGEVIKIDKINIDLGDSDFKTSDTALAENMMLQIKNAIRSKLTGGNTAEKVSRIPLPVAKLDAIFHFLKKGYLPAATLKIDLEDDFKYLIQEKFNLLIIALKRGFEEVGGVVFLRLAMQFSDEVLELFIKKISEQHQNQWAEVIRKKIFRKLRELSNRNRKRLWKILIELVFSNNQTIVAGRLISFLKKDVKAPEKFAESCESYLEEKLSTKLSEETNEIDEKIQKDPSFIFGKNVGVILLHPFLKSFFEESNLLNDQGKFKNEEAKEKAIGLLHFLATGKTEAPEFDLSFQKIICGVPIGIPITSEFDISEAEKKEAKKMLQAVINYWSGLGNVSIDGLREGFFQREGKIHLDEDSILLQVEKKTMDILMGKIPWNISIVKLPWLEKMIRVDWA